MKTELQEAMASGVLVEVRDARGHSLGNAVFFDWRGRPLPAVGDLMRCEIAWHGTGRSGPCTGRVRSRHFDVQRSDAGETEVWVRLVLEPVERPERPAPRAAAAYRARFSAN
jgi:hypothetical protein